MMVSEGLVYSVWGLGFSVIRFRGLGFRVLGADSQEWAWLNTLYVAVLHMSALWQHQSTW